MKTLEELRKKNYILIPLWNNIDSSLAFSDTEIY